MSNIKLFNHQQVMMENDFEIYHYKQIHPLNIDFHSHDFYEIYAFIEGNVTYHIEDKVFDLLPGDILVIPPGKLHKPNVKAGEYYERIVLWIKPEFIYTLDSESPTLLENLKIMKKSNRLFVNIKGKEYKQIRDLLDLLVDTAYSDLYKKDILCRAYITIYLAKLTHLSFFQDEPKNVSEGIIPSVIQYINAHLTEKLKSEDIAEKFFISKFYLNRLFKEHTNVTMYDYIISKRIIYAKSLIRHGYKVTDACFECGFKDYSNFYKSFVAKTGITPKEFKNMNK